VTTDRWEEWRAKEREQERRSLALIEGALANDAWGATMTAVSEGLAEHVPGIVYRLWREGRLSGPGELYDATAWSWIHNRSPEPCIGQRRWLQLFKAAGFLVAYVDQVKRGDEAVPAKFELITEKPTEPLTLWRGAALNKAKAMAWTVHRECAVEFAEAWADPYRSACGLFTATVPPQAMLGVFGDEREQEVVVNPNMLRGRAAPKLVEEVEPDWAELAEQEKRLHAVMVKGGRS
jgi:hypothetical protein